MKLQRLLALLILIICQTISQVSLFVISKRVTKVGVVAVYPRHVYGSRFQVLLCSLHGIKGCIKINKNAADTIAQTPR